MTYLSGLAAFVEKGLGTRLDVVILLQMGLTISLLRVTDFLQVRLGILKTGIFNVADISVTLGLVLVMIAYARQRKPNVG